ncbi:hypothetical protein [Butyrivibrio fibrisolvens]|uniref:hypothetical protein n=1 Tax=Butyrivibrio fibrisolvens TaxID=831 RepID=UPI0003B6B293|nr:hypothetical protein [Butyrivibrio fibrisolvens]
MVEVDEAVNAAVKAGFNCICEKGVVYAKVGSKKEGKDFAKLLRDIGYNRSLGYRILQSKNHFINPLSAENLGTSALRMKAALIN